MSPNDILGIWSPSRSNADFFIVEVIPYWEVLCASAAGEEIPYLPWYGLRIDVLNDADWLAIFECDKEDSLKILA